MSKETTLIPAERVESKIFLIRGQKVMLDTALAELYDVKTHVLNQAVKRNLERFPADFMFQLSKQEYNILKSQIVISSWGGRRNLPYAFTEQGIAMLSGLLRSKRAILVNIAIMRAFVKLRQVLATHKELSRKLYELEQKVGENSAEIKRVFDAIRELMEPPKVKPKRIGFLVDREEEAIE